MQVRRQCNYCTKNLHHGPELELVLRWKSIEHFLLFANLGLIEVGRQYKTKLNNNLYYGGAILVKCFCWYGTKSETVNHFSSEVLQCCIINERRIFSYHTKVLYQHTLRFEPVSFLQHSKFNHDPFDFWR